MKFPRSPGYRMVPTAALILAGAVLINAQEAQNNQGVSIVPVDSARRVDIFIDGKPFTSYIFSEDLRKPVLFPLHASSGTIVTRGFPLEPRAGERVDHPHHVGLWFNYESVNGVDFWNNSTARNPQEQAKMGTIYHRQIKRAQNGRENGELVTESDWIMPDKSRVITEHTDFIFRKSLNDPKIRIIDRIATLTAQDTRVEFKDAKDGMLGLRVARQLEQPSNEPLVFTDASGRKSAVPKLDNTGVTGKYLSSEGKKGDDVWSTRGRWTMLSGRIGDEPVTIAIFDHPKNPGFPTYWHARGYGLFAANPLGQEVFSKGKQKLGFTLQPYQSAIFRYRIVIFDGAMTPQQAEEQYKDFITQVK